MARTASKRKTEPKLTYAISYGFLGGPANSWLLRRLLRKQGYRAAGKMEEADIIIAHSAGCWLIPQSASPKLVVFIGMPLSEAHPHQTFKAAQRKNIRAFIHHLHLLRGLLIGFYSLYYALAQPVRNRDIMHRAKQVPAATEFSNASVVFINNRDDPWPQSEKLKAYLKTRDWAFISLPGSHNDIWEYPQRYAAIIERYARLLA